MAADAKKFHDVWVMNEQDVKELLFKAVAQDRLIHEHQLGLEYREPNLYVKETSLFCIYFDIKNVYLYKIAECCRDFTTNVGPVMSNAAKSRGIPATQVLREVMSIASDLTEDEPIPIQHGHGESTILQKFSPNTIKSVLELLCDESVSNIWNATTPHCQPCFFSTPHSSLSTGVFGRVQTT